MIAAEQNNVTINIFCHENSCVYMSSHGLKVAYTFKSEKNFFILLHVRRITFFQKFGRKKVRKESLQNPTPEKINLLDKNTIIIY